MKQAGAAGQAGPTEPAVDFLTDMRRIADELYLELDGHFQSAIRNYGTERRKRWQPDYSGEAAYLDSIAPNRARLIEILGGFPDAKLELNPRREPLFEAEDCSAYWVTLDALPGVAARGILLIPKGVRFPTAAVMAQHGYVSAPEDVVGLKDPNSAYHAYGRKLVQRGYVVLAHKNLSFKAPRSRIHRKAMLMGMTLLGLEIWKTLRVVDYLQSIPEVDPSHIGNYGISQGGMTALYAAACDQRIAASVVCAYFNERTAKMAEPGGENYTAYIDTDELDKDIHGLLEFTDVELAGLICPRPLLIEAGKNDGACHWPMVEREFPNADSIYKQLGAGDRIELDLHEGGHEIRGVRSLAFLDRWLKPRKPKPTPRATNLEALGDVSGRIEQIQDETFRELDTYLHDLTLGHEPRRARLWKKDFASLEAYEVSVAPNRERLIEQLGGFPEKQIELNPRREPFANWEDCQAFRVTLDVLEGVTAKGILLVPNGLRGPAAALIVQHGMGGNPEDVLGLIEEDPYYHGFARTLAGRGYVVFAHKVISVGEQRGRLHRKALLTGKTLLGIDIWKFKCVVDYLQSLPQVDAGRIGMYGLSQGGLSTLYAAAAERRIKVAVCTAYFNDRVPKMVVSDTKYTSFIDTPEHDKFIHGHLAEFSDSDLAALICPRPFMVEAGKGDRAVYWPMLLEEFAKVKETYDRLGISERAELDLHDLGHEIHGVASFEFVDRWLK